MLPCPLCHCYAFKALLQILMLESGTVQMKKNPHFLFFSMINCLFFWEKLGEIVENFSKFLQEIQYFLQEIPVFLPEILGFCL